MVGAASGVCARRNDANRLTFKYRKGHVTKIQHDVVGVVVLLPLLFADFRHAHIAGHGGGDGFLCRFGAVQIGVRMRGRPRGNGGAELGRVET